MRWLRSYLPRHDAALIARTRHEDEAIFISEKAETASFLAVMGAFGWKYNVNGRMKNEDEAILMEDKAETASFLAVTRVFGWKTASLRAERSGAKQSEI